MNKKTLVSLLAIPVFSFVTVFNPFNYSFSATPFNSYQETQESKKIKAKTIAVGVIDFLLRGKIADKMKMTSDEKLGLGILGDLLRTQDQREHELDVAAAGRNQLIINTSDGRQAQFVKDEGGNIYLVMDGVIHPISQELVSQAKNISGIENATLPPYDLKDLEIKFMWNSLEDSRTQEKYVLQEEGEYLSDIAKKFNVPESDVKIRYKGMLYDIITDPNFKEITENKKKIKKNTFKGKLVIDIKDYKNKISPLFSYKWEGDLDNDGTLGFNEFHQIKRTFYNDEDFNIGAIYQTAKGFMGTLEIKILEENTGKLLINQKTTVSLNGPKILIQPISAGSLPIGIYLIHTNLMNDNLSTVSSASERLEIVQRPFEIKK